MSELTDATGGPRPLSARSVIATSLLGAAVAEVRRAVDGGAADVHRHLAGLAELDGRDGPLGGVEQLQHGRSGYRCAVRGLNHVDAARPGPGNACADGGMAEAGA